MLYILLHNVFYNASCCHLASHFLSHSPFSSHFSVILTFTIVYSSHVLSLLPCSSFIQPLFSFSLVYSSHFISLFSSHFPAISFSIAYSSHLPSHYPFLPIFQPSSHFLLPVLPIFSHSPFSSLFPALFSFSVAYGG